MSRFVLEARGMFTLIQQTYYNHLNEEILKNVPGLDPVQRALDETEEGVNSVKIISEAAEDVYSGSFNKEYKVFSYNDIILWLWPTQNPSDSILTPKYCNLLHTSFQANILKVKS